MYNIRKNKNMTKKKKTNRKNKEKILTLVKSHYRHVWKKKNKS